MFIILSDLHLSEAQSTKIGDLKFNKNLPVEIYQAYLNEIKQVAVSNGIKKVDLVLAGDILEINRSGFWFENDVRPYQDNDDIQPGSSAEATILRIIEAISREENVKETLSLFRDIQSHYDVEISLSYLLGNHDRLVNATPKIRETVRTLFGLSGGDLPFDHQFIGRNEDGSPFCLVRHGHEYDPMNFSLDTHELEVIPAEFPEKVYGAATLGDITSVEFGAALPYYFVKEYGEEQILGNPILMALYERLMGFDDVRPVSALLPYLFSAPGLKKRHTWEFMAPCFKKLLIKLSETPQFMDQITQASTLNRGQKLLVLGLLTSKMVQRDLPYWMIKQLMKQVSKKIKLSSPVKWAKREALVSEKHSSVKCVISGHTHFPEVSLMSAKKGDERYYINTGTWRNTIPATRNYKGFGRLKTMTKVFVFQPSENTHPQNEEDWSFHFLTGVSYGNNRHL